MFTTIERSVDIVKHSTDVYASRSSLKNNVKEIPNVKGVYIESLRTCTMQLTCNNTFIMAVMYWIYSVYCV
jgi:hypothetical protein